MLHDPTNNPKPGEIQRFNTKEIMIYFVNLLNPEKFQNLDNHTKASLAEISHAIAQIGKDTQITIPSEIEKMKAHLGRPAKGTKAEEVLNRVITFENNFIPSLMIQQEERKKDFGILRTQLDLLVAQGANLPVSRLESLKAEIQRYRENKLQAYLTQKNDLSEKLQGLREEVGKATGVKLAHTEEEGLTAATEAAPQNITTPPDAGQQLPPTPS